MKSVTLRPEEIETLARMSYDTLADLGLEELRVRVMDAVGFYAEDSISSHQRNARLRDFQRRNRFRLAFLRKRDPAAHAALLLAAEIAASQDEDLMPEVPE